jgi:hypothetical protein
MGVDELSTDRDLAIGDDHAHDRRVLLVHGVSFRDGWMGLGRPTAEADRWYGDRGEGRREAVAASGAVEGATPTAPSHAEIGAAGCRRNGEIGCQHRGTSFGARSGLHCRMHHQRVEIQEVFGEDAST